MWAPHGSVCSCIKNFVPNGHHEIWMRTRPYIISEVVCTVDSWGKNACYNKRSWSLNLQWMKKQDSSEKGQQKTEKYEQNSSFIRWLTMIGVWRHASSRTLPGVWFRLGYTFGFGESPSRARGTCPYSVCNLLDKEIRYGKNMYVSQWDHGMSSF